MKKRILLVALAMGLLLLSVALVLAACSSVKGTYYQVSGDKLNESSWIDLSGGKWTDDENASGTYKKSGDNITFFVDGEELCSGTLKDGTLELKMFGESLGIFRTKKAQEKYLKLLGKQTSDDAVYTITLDAGDGTLTSGTSATVNYNSAYNLPTPSLLGYTFTGWYLGSTQVTNEYGDSISNWTYTSDQTFTAGWEHTRYNVFFSENISEAGYIPNNTTRYYGVSVTISATTKSGYTWVGWFDGDTRVSESASYTFTMPAHDVLYTAKWCKVTLEKNYLQAGTITSLNDKYSEGDQVTVTAQTNPGFTWLGWYDGTTKVSDGASLDYTFEMPSQNKTYTAKWMPCPVTLETNLLGAGELCGVEGATVAGESTTITAIPNNGYTWLGWYDGETKVSEGDSLSYTFTMPTQSKTYTAKWTYYTLTTQTNLGAAGNYTLKSDTKTTAGSSVTLTAATNSGYTWLGWYDGETKVSEGTNLDYTFTMPAQNKTFTAKWACYTLTTNTNLFGAGSYTVKVTEPVTLGQSCTLTASTNPGYTWAGWFDGETKVSEGESRTYTFDMPADDKTFTAKFAECTEHTPGDDCICTKCNAVAHTPNANGYCEKCGFKRDGNYVYFGSYPQTIKANDVEITSTTDARGYYLGTDGEYYAQVTAAPYRSNYTFSSGATIVNNTTYYFKVEPVKWRILSESNGEAFIFCDLVLDAHSYNSLADTSQFYHNGGTGYSNNYALSDIRNWLNSTFYDSVFTTLQKQLVLLTTVDNSKESTLMYNTTGKNDYACEDTEDYVFLLSEREVTTPNYGFKSSNTTSNDLERKKFGTDYSMARGVYYTSDKYGSWWLRSPNSKTEAYIVNYYGFAHGGATVDQIKYGIVPAINIKL